MSTEALTAAELITSPKAFCSIPQVGLSTIIVFSASMALTFLYIYTDFIEKDNR